MSQTVTEAQGSYPTLYVDGQEVDETAEAMVEAERVQVEWSAVSNGYVSEGWNCTYCDEIFETEEEAQQHAETDHGPDAADVVQVAPLINSAAIDWSGKTYDGVTVSISVGDPRGAFVMTVRRLDDGTMLLHVPHAGDSMPHMDLTEINPGTYKIGA